MTKIVLGFHSSHIYTEHSRWFRYVGVCDIVSLYNSFEKCYYDFYNACDFLYFFVLGHLHLVSVK